MPTPLPLPSPRLAAGPALGPASLAGAAPRQTTLAAAFDLSGRGLHTGRRATVRVCPAAADGGILFRRRLPRGTWTSVPALWQHQVPQTLCTALQAPDGHLVRTVEHLLAALSAFAIDNALVEIDAEELPIFDGSALPWCAAIRAAGRAELGTPRRRIRLRRIVEVRDGRRSLSIAPADALSVEAQLSLAHLGEMRWEGTITPETFEGALAPARSFGRLKWAVPLKLYALATGRPILRGATLSSTAAIVGGRVIGGMRGPAEPVRHRVLDLVGDLALAGHPILGHVRAAHTGHALNHALVAKLMRDPGAWELV
ncbi:UDP-3-O-acyl-N-acetylglucosamine deacetylase [Methylobacterium segetis]|uniref:UDP-3-O-acyl-N-acetylglucosamine deacetylase n=1 Tax=Methylobacterium segetis TaxID=2488750 RepID=UPI00104B5C3F|nr:UDP-3-O-acyl-N-acetylglucosamine deacetylase [Methylobacterium segetis]